MSSSDKPLLEFPCHFEFKAFGPGGSDAFVAAVQAAASRVVPVPRDAMRVRASSGGKYQCVTLLMALQNRAQLEAVYRELRRVDNLKYLL